MSSSTATALERTLDAYLKAWERYDAKAMISTFSDDVVQRTLPLSLQTPARSRAEIEYILPEIEQVVNNHRLQIEERIADPTSRRASVRALSTADTPLGPWNNEYAVFFEFDETCEKLTRVDEIMDSNFVKDFFPKFMQHMAEKRK